MTEAGLTENVGARVELQLGGFYARGRLARGSDVGSESPYVLVTREGRPNEDPAWFDIPSSTVVDSLRLLEAP